MSPSESARPGEAGFTLIEVLVTLTAGLVILFAVLAVIDLTARQTRIENDRSRSLNDAALGFERMQSDIRQATSLTPLPTAAQTGGVSSSSVRIGMWATVGANPTLRTIEYDCGQPGEAAGSFACYRSDVTGGVTSARQVVIPNLIGDPQAVFTVLPPQGGAVLPTVEIKVRERVSDDRGPSAITSRVTPRNCLDGYFVGRTTCAD